MHYSKPIIIIITLSMNHVYSDSEPTEDVGSIIMYTIIMCDFCVRVCVCASEMVPYLALGLICASAMSATGTKTPTLNCRTHMETWTYPTTCSPVSFAQQFLNLVYNIYMHELLFYYTITLIVLNKSIRKIKCDGIY